MQQHNAICPAKIGDVYYLHLIVLLVLLVIV